jgi:hypothetical protein
MRLRPSRKKTVRCATFSFGVVSSFASVFGVDGDHRHFGTGPLRDVIVVGECVDVTMKQKQ